MRAADATAAAARGLQPGVPGVTLGKQWSRTRDTSDAAIDAKAQLRVAAARSHGSRSAVLAYANSTPPPCPRASMPRLGAVLANSTARLHVTTRSSTRRCEELADLFEGGRFRSTIDMARHRFGDGRYRYFDHPLPDAIQELRGSFYGHLAPIANEWSALLGGEADAFPLEHEQLLGRCRDAGQERPTPLMLRYSAGDWNALHQDLYGDVYFPFQVLTVLSEPMRRLRGRRVRAGRATAARQAGRTCSTRRGALRDLARPRAPQQGKRGYTAWGCAIKW